MKQRVFDSLTLILFHKNYNLVKLFQHKFDDYSLQKVSMERNDLKQELSIWLYESIQAYCYKFIDGEEKNFKNLRKYCFISLKNNMINFLKEIQKGQRRKMINIEDLQLPEIEKQKLIEIEFEHFYFNGVDVLKFLTMKERIIFRRYILGYKIREIAKKFNYPMGSVSLAIKKSKIKIKNGLIEKGVLEQ